MVGHILLLPQVLSVVAQQVLEIQLAVKAKVASFTFEGSELRLRPTCNGEYVLRQDIWGNRTYSPAPRWYTHPIPEHAAVLCCLQCSSP
jgi:hypothetical protein